MNTLPDDPLRAGEQYFLGLAGNIKKGPIAKAGACYCAPAFEKFEKKLERDKKELMKHIDSSHNKLDTKISHLERKTRDQLFNLNQSMKESFALERSECLDRMDRRALRERIAIERQQAVRDVGLKRDLASWLDKKLQEIEVKHGADAKNAALLRSLAMRASKRGKKSVLSDMEGGGHVGLRRAMSEELLSDIGLCDEDLLVPDLPQQCDGACDVAITDNSLYKGLKVSDKPSLTRLVSSARVRRNSAGDETQIVTPSSPDTVPGPESRHPYQHEIMSHSTASESFHDTSVSSVVSRDMPRSTGDQVTSANTSSELPMLQSNRMGSQRNGLIRPIPMCFSSENLQSHPNMIQGETNKPPAGYQPASDNQNYHFPSQMNPIRRFTTEADIHHATPMMLDSPSSTSSALPPYRAPPHPIPSHVYHPRDRLPRPGPLLPPVDEDEYVPIDEKDQDFHRQLLNLPLQSDVGSHDSHNDSGYSTRLGASSGPSPSLSGKYPMLSVSYYHIIVIVGCGVNFQLLSFQLLINIKYFSTLFSQ